MIRGWECTKSPDGGPYDRWLREQMLKILAEKQSAMQQKLKTLVRGRLVYTPSHWLSVVVTIYPMPPYELQNFLVAVRRRVRTLEMAFHEDFRQCIAIKALPVDVFAPKVFLANTARKPEKPRNPPLPHRSTQ